MYYNNLIVNSHSIQNFDIYDTHISAKSKHYYRKWLSIWIFLHGEVPSVVGVAADSNAAGDGVAGGAGEAGGKGGGSVSVFLIEFNTAEPGHRRQPAWNLHHGCNL